MGNSNQQDEITKVEYCGISIDVSKCPECEIKYVADYPECGGYVWEVKCTNTCTDCDGIICDFKRQEYSKLNNKKEP